MIADLISAHLIRDSRAIVLLWFLALYAGWFIVSRMSHRLAAGVLSIGAVILFFQYWPDVPLGDDAAIVLKYMDNFARGFFYAYNPEDGPVFGISGFIHGIVAGGFAYFHLFSPLQSLYASNFIGAILVCCISFEIIAWHTGERSLLLVPEWALLLLTSGLFITNAKNGLETPIHLALVLAGFLFYVRRSTKLLVLFSVLAVISKLDAIPIAGTILVADIFRNRASFRSGHFRREYTRTFLLYGAVPLLVWLFISSALFGSPLPQSAYAKFLYHRSTSQFWFPFLEALFTEKNRTLLVLALLFCAAYGGTLFYTIRRRSVQSAFTTFVYGPAIIAYLASFYVYNPAERMGWYYVVPAFLLGVQCIILAHEFLLKRLERFGVVIGVLGVACCAAFYWPQLESLIQRSAFRLHLVEDERRAIGQWVKEQSVASDTLLTGFGHIAEASGLYTIDYSGLNSRTVTDMKLEFPSIVARYGPRWIVLDTFLTGEIHRRYKLRRSYFNLASLGKETWRVYERDTAENHGTEFGLTERHVVSNVHVAHLKSGEVSCRGAVVSFAHFGDSLHAGSFVVGLARKASDLVISASFLPVGGRAVQSTVLRKRDTSSFVEGYTRQWEILLKKEQAISAVTITVLDPPGEEVEILSPAFVDVEFR